MQNGEESHAAASVTKRRLQNASNAFFIVLNTDPIVQLLCFLAKHNF